MADPTPPNPIPPGIPDYPKQPPPVTQAPAPLSIPTASSINSTAVPAADRQLTIAALDALLPIHYGQVRAQALLANALVYQGNWVFWVLWGLGPMQSIDSYTLNDQPAPAGVTVTHYLGTQVQGIDPTLAAAFATWWTGFGSGLPTYTEKLPGIAYSVFTAPPSALSGPPQFNAILKGLKIYDPRLDSTNGGTGSQRLADSTTWTWSRNPALILADYLGNPYYGDGRTLDWPSVIVTANACDTVVGTAPNTETQRLADFSIIAQASTSSWTETLRAAACCWIVPNGDVVKLVPDVARSVDASYSHTSGNIIQINADSLRRTRDLPTVVEVVYTDTSQTPWRDVPVLAKRAGVDSGATPWRKSTVAMNWVTRATQANREAIERLNKLWLRSISMDVYLMDEGIVHEPGDVIAVTYPDSGYTALNLRAVKVAPNADGWVISTEKEDPAAYSLTVQTGGGGTITNWPVPTNPPAPTGLTWAQELYQDGQGTIRARMRAAWNDVALGWPFFIGYRVEVYVGAVLIDTPSLTKVPSFAWGPVQEGQTYTVNVYTASTVAVSAAASATATAPGKQAKPGDIPYLYVSEAAGEARFNWIPGVDLDTVATELRFGPVSTATWATAQLIDRIAMPARTFATRSIPPGNYRFFAKALDSVRTTTYPWGQESVNAKTFDLNIGGNPELFIANTYTYVSPTLTNMVSWTKADGTRSWVTDYGTLWNTLFNSASAMATAYPAILDTYFGAGTSGLVTEAFDFGAPYSGTITTTFAYTDLVGAAQPFIEVSLDNVAWTQFPGLSAVANARFVRISITTAGVLRVDSLGTMQLSVVAITESGEITTSASAYVTVTLSRKYAKVKQIQTTADVTAGQRNPGYANIVLANDPRYLQVGYVPEDYVDENFLPNCSFDVACWDGLNNQVANLVKWTFQGI